MATLSFSAFLLAWSLRTKSGIGGTRLINNSRGKPYFSVAILPDNRLETLAVFRRSSM